MLNVKNKSMGSAELMNYRMRGPRRDQRIVKPNEQLWEDAENDHQDDQRHEDSAFGVIDIGEISHGGAGARSVENALPEREQE